MDDADLTNVLAIGSYFSRSLQDVKSINGGDFTDAQIPDKTLKQLCLRNDIDQTNPITGVTTKDSLMCL